MDKFIAIKPAATYALSTGGRDIAGSWETDLLVDGTIAFLDEGGTIIASNVSGGLAAVASPYVTLIRSMGATKTPMRLDAIDVPTLSVKKVAYKAPITKKMALGQHTAGAVDPLVDLNLPALIANGDTCILYITDLDLPIENNHRTRIYQLDVVDSDVITGTTSDNILVKLVAKVNADPNRLCNLTAISGNGTDVDGILSTGLTTGSNYSLSLGAGILELATISSYQMKNGVFVSGFTSPLTIASDGLGTYTQMREFEKRSEAMLGNNGLPYMGTSLYTEDSQLVPGTTYTTYELSWTPPLNDDLIRTNGFRNHALLAVRSADATLIGVLDRLFVGKITTVSVPY